MSHPMKDAAILIVDDDADLRDLVRLAVEPTNVDVIEASSCGDGIAALHANRGRIRLVLLDYFMPGMDASSCARELCNLASPAMVATSKLPKWPVSRSTLEANRRCVSGTPAYETLIDACAMLQSALSSLAPTLTISTRLFQPETVTAGIVSVSAEVPSHAVLIELVSNVIGAEPHVCTYEQPVAATHVSVVHAFASSHRALLGACVIVSLASLHASTVHAMPSFVAGGVPG